MSKEILNYAMTLLPVTVTTETGQTAQGHLVQFACRGGEREGNHPAASSSMMHGSPLRGPLFLYQTPDELDAALFAFNEKLQVPIYFADPTGTIEHAHGQKLAFNWPNKCRGKVELLLTM